MYGCIAEALDVTPNSSMTFLNIGSGTGYLSTIVAKILGPTGVCYGIEINQDIIDHCLSSMERYKSANSVTDLAHMEFILGNGLQIDPNSGESNVGYDRIYIGASIEKRNLKQLASLLRPGGVLVGPGKELEEQSYCIVIHVADVALSQFAVDDELIKVFRVAKSNAPSVSSVARGLRGRFANLSEDFTQQVISGVRFAPLLKSPHIETKIYCRIWNPLIHRNYPESFRKSCKEILLCANASATQPPEPARERTNAAAKLPKTLWIEVLSYTRRDWFEHPQSELDLLRRQLAEQKLAVQREQEARQEAETRLRVAERERDGLRLLTTRLQSRLQAMENGEEVDFNASASRDVETFINDPFLLRGIGALIRRFQQDSSEDEDDDDGGGEDNAGGNHDRFESGSMDGADQEDMEADSVGGSVAAMDEESDSDSTMAASPPTASSSIENARVASIAGQSL
jgi:protein-L-isoaspartate O-methyltransferase